MQLRQVGLLGDPQSAAHRRRFAAQPHAQLHGPDLTVVYHPHTLTVGAPPIAKYSRANTLYVVHEHVDDCSAALPAIVTYKGHALFRFVQRIHSFNLQTSDYDLRNHG